MALNIIGNSSENVYAKGDVCLQLTPFDNYRMFTLYTDWRNVDRQPLDLTGNQKIYLVFKSKSKEIRIPEFDNIDSKYNVDKVNGQVVFKISQKNSVDILAMDTKTFYITRVFEIIDTEGNFIKSSEEEVLYTGEWKEEGSRGPENLTAQVRALNEVVTSLRENVAELQRTNADLIQQNVDFAVQIEEYKSLKESLESEKMDLEAKIAKYESGEIYEGELLDNSATRTNIITHRTYTEDELKNLVDSFSETIIMK